jgi:hypothetical protein
MLVELARLACILRPALGPSPVALQYGYMQNCLLLLLDHW